MSTINFQVRAFDENGFHSKREFSIDYKKKSRIRFIATTFSGMYYSYNGINWQWDERVRGQNIIRADGRWVVSGSFIDTSRTSNTIQVSRNGYDWTTVALPSSIVAGSSKVHFCNGQWIATYRPSTSLTYFATTTTPEIASSWVPYSINLGANKVVTKVIHDGSRYIFCVMDVSTAATTRLMSSQDLNTFQNITISGSVGRTFEATHSQNDIFFLNGKYIFVNSSPAGSLIFESLNLNTWSQRIISGIWTGSTGVPCYGNGVIVLPLAKQASGGMLSRVLSSVDGGSVWSSSDFVPLQTKSENQYIRSLVKFSRGQFYMLFRISAGETVKSVIQTSMDGINWTEIATPELDTVGNAVIIQDFDCVEDN